MEEGLSSSNNEEILGYFFYWASFNIFIQISSLNIGLVVCIFRFQKRFDVEGFGLSNLASMYTIGHFGILLSKIGQISPLSSGHPALQKTPLVFVCTNGGNYHKLKL
jgi:hypothetical protein